MASVLASSQHAPASRKTDRTENEWVIVSEDETDETKVVFDTIGDEFIGVYLGKRVIENEDGSFTQQRFAVGEQHYFTNGNHSMNQGLTKVQVGRLVRVTYASDKDTGKGDPMRVYRVEVSKTRVAKSR